MYCHGPIGTTEFVLYRKVKCIVSFIWSVLYLECPLTEVLLYTHVSKLQDC